MFYLTNNYNNLVKIVCKNNNIHNLIGGSKKKKK